MPTADWFGGTDLSKLSNIQVAQAPKMMHVSKILSGYEIAMSQVFQNIVTCCLSKISSKLSEMLDLLRTAASHRPPHQARNSNAERRGRCSALGPSFTGGLPYSTAVAPVF